MRYFWFTDLSVAYYFILLMSFHTTAIFCDSVPRPTNDLHCTAASNNASLTHPLTSGMSHSKHACLLKSEKFSTFCNVVN